MLQTERTYQRNGGSIGQPPSPFTSGIIREAAFELAWPTRCAVCDAPGDLLCDSCRRALRFYDPWLACPNCGAPFGYFQCCACNSYIRERRGQSDQPLSCSSALLFDEVSGAIIRSYKDAGEQRLAQIVADMMHDCLSPEAWSNFDAIAFIPNTNEALLRRGFDHMESVARKIARAEHIPLMQAFERPRNCDQRNLTQLERQQNMQQAFTLRSQFCALKVPKRILLVDDVMTTGATLEAAAGVLRNAGAQKIWGLTFARVV